MLENQARDVKLCSEKSAFRAREARWFVSAQIMRVMLMLLTRETRERETTLIDVLRTVAARSDGDQNLGV